MRYLFLWITMIQVAAWAQDAQDLSSITSFQGELYVFRKNTSYSFDMQDFKKYYAKYSDQEREYVAQYTALEEQRRQSGYYELKQELTLLEELILENTTDEDTREDLEDRKEDILEALNDIEDKTHEMRWIAWKISSAYEMKQNLIDNYIESQPSIKIHIFKTSDTSMRAEIQWTSDYIQFQNITAETITYNEKNYSLQVTFPLDDQRKMKLKTTSVQKRAGAIFLNGDLEIIKQDDPHTIYSIVQNGYFSLNLSK